MTDPTPKDITPADASPKEPAKAYVWAVLRPEDLPAMQAALEHLKTYTLADHAHLRVVDRTASGADAWDHAYMAGNPTYTHAAIMDGWCSTYTKTLSDMHTAWEFFHHGWKAHARRSRKVDLRHEAQWVVKLGESYHPTRCVPAPVYVAKPERRPSWTHDLDKAHPFKGRKEAEAYLATLESCVLPSYELWAPAVGQRNDFR